MKILAVTVLLTAGLVNLHALNIFGNEYTAGIEARLGTSSARMFEKVYQDSSSDNLISEIDWASGFQIGAGAGFFAGPLDPYKQFSVSLEGKCMWYFPVNSWTVRDSDWDDDGNIFSYGESLATTLMAIEVEGMIAASFPIRDKYIIEAGIRLWYSRHGVMAHNGWVMQVMPGERLDNSVEKIQLYGISMEYIQEWLAFAPSLGFRRKLANGHIGARAALSPFIWGYHIDNHYFRIMDSADSDQRYINYEDRPRGGLYYQIQCEWFWNLTENTQLGITADYRAVEYARGDTKTSTTGLAGYVWLDENIAGASFSSVSFGLTIRTTL